MGEIGSSGGRKMKEMVKEEQKINLINCEKIQASEALQNNSSQIRCSIPVKIKFLDKI